MKLLVISLEFEAGTFSGNGVYCQTQVHALSSLGHAVMVISGAPPGTAGQAERTKGLVHLIQVPLSKWGTLDSSCAHAEFAQAFEAAWLAERVRAFGPDAVLGVDWHAAAPFRALSAALAAPCPFVYLNYRLHSRTDAACLEAERAAFQAAALSVLLCRADAEHAAGLYASGMREVLLPPLRDDLAALSAADCQAGLSPRPYLVCAVRCSAEKEPERFVALVEAMVSRGGLPDGVVPLVCGAGWAASPLGEGLVRRLKAAAPGTVVHAAFMGPEDMAGLYRATRLNVHPCVHDAYGMTVVEAASFGAPSLVQKGGTVGATDLLQEEDQVVGVDYEAVSDHELADFVIGLLKDTERLERVGAAARRKALSYSALDNGRRLAALVSSIVDAEDES